MTPAAAVRMPLFALLAGQEPGWHAARRSVWRRRHAGRWAAAPGGRRRNRLLHSWRRRRSQGSADGLGPAAPGPMPSNSTAPRGRHSSCPPGVDLAAPHTTAAEVSASPGPGEGGSPPRATKDARVEPERIEVLKMRAPKGPPTVLMVAGRVAAGFLLAATLWWDNQPPRAPAPGGPGRDLRQRRCPFGRR